MKLKDFIAISESGNILEGTESLNRCSIEGTNAECWTFRTMSAWSERSGSRTLAASDRHKQSHGHQHRRRPCGIRELDRYKLHVIPASISKNASPRFSQVLSVDRYKLHENRLQDCPAPQLRHVANCHMLAAWQRMSEFPTSSMPWPSWSPSCKIAASPSSWSIGPSGESRRPSRLAWRRESVHLMPQRP